MALSALTIKPSSFHTASLIFLHGLGDTGHGWASILESIVPSYCKLVCPHAATLPLTVYGGERIPAWFDVLARTPASAVQDPASVTRACAQVEQLVSEEASALAAFGGSKRCLLGGFSQGGALALYTGLTSERTGQLAGLIGLSCYLPLMDQLERLDLPATRAPPPPVFVAHGDADEVVRPEMGAAARELMQRRLRVADLRFHCYSGLEHCAGDQEMTDLREFISAAIPVISETSTSASETEGR